MHNHQTAEHLDVMINNTFVFVPLLSWACTRHHELWCDQGAACAHHVVAAWSITEKEWCGEHLHQEPRQVHRQQSSVWHLLCFWKHPVMQGKIPEAISILYLLKQGVVGCHYCGLGMWVYTKNHGAVFCSQRLSPPKTPQSPQGNPQCSHVWL